MASTKGVRFYDMVVGKEAAFLPMVPQLKDAKFHPTGQRLFTGTVDGLYDWPLREEKGVIQLGPARKLAGVGRVEQISLDREGRFLATAGSSNGWILDLVKTPNIVQRVDHANVIFVAISPGGEYTATGTHNGFGAKVWETKTGNCLIDLLPDERIVTVAFSPDARWLVTGTASAVDIWETDDWKLHLRIPINYQADRCAFSVDSKLLAIALSPSVIQVLDPKTGQSIAQLTVPDTELHIPVCFSPDCSQFVLRTRAGFIRFWDFRRIREGLTEIGLDWDLPPYLPAIPPSDLKPMRIVADFGDMKSKEPQSE